MKKNLVPLLGISVVVALITTAIFYALISAKMTGSVEARTDRSGAPPPDPRFQAAAELGVPSGMRAVSVQVADSSGVLSVLKPGHRVDVQAVHMRSQNQFDVELKTVLQNLEVWKVHPQPEAMPGRHSLPVVTLLASPGDADVLALADAGARIRLALRNPEDAEQTEKLSIAIHTLMRNPKPARSPRSAGASGQQVKPAPGQAQEPQPTHSPVLH